MGVLQVFADTHHRLIERQSSLYADYGQVEGVRKTEADTQLPVPHHALEHEARQKKTERRDSQKEHGIVKTADGQHRSKSDQSTQNSNTKVDRQVSGFAISGLNQPATST